MPHIPRQALNSTGGIRPELTTVPRQPRRPGKPPVPYQGSSAGEEPYQLNQGGDPSAGRLSIRNHTVDPAKVAQQLFGKDAQSDEYTGELVLRDQ